MQVIKQYQVSLNMEMEAFLETAKYQSIHITDFRIFNFRS